nr:MAG TPA: hypothetical protein [Caudoviricetes sp.]
MYKKCFLSTHHHPFGTIVTVYMDVIARITHRRCNIIQGQLHHIRQIILNILCAFQQHIITIGLISRKKRHQIFNQYIFLYTR